MMDCRVRLAAPSDADAIYQLVTAEFSSSVSRYTTAGQHGYRNYLVDKLATQVTDPVQKFVIVESDEGLIAFLDLRIRNSQNVFLSRICVARDRQSSGVGSNVLQTINRCLGGTPRWSLDVFNFNHGAIRLYSRLGLVATSSSIWLRRKLPDSSGRIRIRDFSSVLAKYRRYGFSPFYLIDGPAATFSLIGDAVRVPDAQQLSDSALLGSLRTEFPHLNSAIAIRPEGASNINDPRSEVIALSVRMEGRFAIGD